MTKNHDRAKRLDKRIKAEIIEKEAQNAENVQKLKESQELLVNLRYNN